MACGMGSSLRLFAWDISTSAALGVGVAGGCALDYTTLPLPLACPAGHKSRCPWGPRSASDSAIPAPGGRAPQGKVRPKRRGASRPRDTHDGLTDQHLLPRKGTRGEKEGHQQLLRKRTKLKRRRGKAPRNAAGKGRQTSRKRNAASTRHRPIPMLTNGPHRLNASNHIRRQGPPAAKIKKSTRKPSARPSQNVTPARGLISPSRLRAGQQEPPPLQSTDEHRARRSSGSASGKGLRHRVIRMSGVKLESERGNVARETQGVRWNMHSTALGYRPSSSYVVQSISPASATLHQHANTLHKQNREKGRLGRWRAA